MQTAATRFRERLIEVGRDTMGRSSSWRWWAPRHLTMLLDVWEPMIREQAAAEILAFVKDQHSEACPCDQCIGDEWLRFAARVVARDEDFQDWERKVDEATENS
jgi:hypothetical protein